MPGILLESGLLQLLASYRSFRSSDYRDTYVAVSVVDGISHGAYISLMCGKDLFSHEVIITLQAQQQVIGTSTDEAALSSYLIH